MDDLTWTIHRARETPGKTWVSLALIAVFVVFTAWMFGPLLAVLALAVFFAALNTYFLPVTYRLTSTGIEVDKRVFTARYEWKQFRRWFRTTGGIVISPFSKKTYLDNFRGVHLLLPADSKPIVEYLDRRFAPPSEDTRLRLDEPDEVGSQKAEVRVLNADAERIHHQDAKTPREEDGGILEKPER